MLWHLAKICLTFKVNAGFFYKWRRGRQKLLCLFLCNSHIACVFIVFQNSGDSKTCSQSQRFSGQKDSKRICSITLGRLYNANLHTHLWVTSMFFYVLCILARRSTQACRSTQAHAHPHAPTQAHLKSTVTY